MPCISELPAPPPGKTGWPWTKAPGVLFEKPPSGGGWPKISIVTPTYNQAEYIEEAIRSVLLQDYPNLQYIVRDGGSTDGSVEIVEKYADWISVFISEPDDGQSDAINKGLRQVEGDIWAYFNSDDLYLPHTFYRVASVFSRKPNVRWVTGTGAYFRGDSDHIVRHMVPVPEMPIARIMTPWREEDGVVASQVANFMRTDILDEYGYFDTSLHYAMDFDFGLRLLVDGVRPYIVDDVLAKARLHDQSKTVSMAGSGAFRREQYEIIQRFMNKLSPEDRAEVRHCIRQAKLHTTCAQALNATSRWEGLTQLARDIWSHPSHLAEQPVLGAIRRLLFSSRSDGQRAAS